MILMLIFLNHHLVVTYLICQIALASNKLFVSQLIFHLSVSSPSLIHYVFVPSDLSCPFYVLPPIFSSDHLSVLSSVPLAQGMKHSLKGSVNFVKYGSTIRPTSILPTFYFPLLPEIVFSFQRCQLLLVYLFKRKSS